MGAIWAALVAPAALAQWQVTNLHPPQGEASRAMSAVGAIQAGWVTMDGSTGHGRHGGYWQGSPGSWVDLNPPVATGGSRVYSTDGVEYVGLYFGENGHRATVWNPGASSYVTLHPAGYEWSVGLGVHGGQQVGWVLGPLVPQEASLWTGTAASWVSLMPAGATGSDATAVHSGQQVGSAVVNGVLVASLWTGTAASWVSLNPSGATHSKAWGVHAGVQVGSAGYGGSERAGMWQGTAASWVDLHPAGATNSQALGVYGDLQVGWATVNGSNRASLWNGSAASWLDLHALLAPEFTSSHASDVWTDGTTTTVTGWGYNSVMLRDEALMWTIPAPGAASVLVAIGWTAGRRRRVE